MTAIGSLLSYTPLGLSLLLGVVWAIRLEGRVNMETQRVDDLKELINARFDGVSDRLLRIENALNGSIRKYNS